MDESKALFVSASKGNDTDGAGTREKPFKTIGTAIAKLTKARRRIYICAGNYPEDIFLTAEHSSLGMIGGIGCDWTPAPDTKPVIGVSSTPFTATMTAGLALADLAISAVNAVESSVGVLVIGGDIALRNVRVSSGNGGPGKNATVVPYDFAMYQQADLDGISATVTNTGASERSVTCPGGAVTKGGRGGDKGEPGSPGTPGPANAGLVSDCSSPVVGAAGATSPNASGATTIGKLGSSGWAPGAGTKGADGGQGQGGGGGYGALGGGGGGGAGGCGGAGSPGAGGGGASIAVALVGAKATFRACQLTATAGGPGGKGSIGQDGQTIFGFRGAGNGAACNGGNGGRGGRGGAGGGGAGGSSFGVAFSGTAPDLGSDTSVAFGSVGAGGQFTGTNPGIDGLARAVFESQ